MKTEYENGWTLGALVQHIKGRQYDKRLPLYLLLLQLKRRASFGDQALLIKELVTIVERAATERLGTGAALLVHYPPCFARLVVACEVYQQYTYATPSLTADEVKRIKDLCAA